MEPSISDLVVRRWEGVSSSIQEDCTTVTVECSSMKRLLSSCLGRKLLLVMVAEFFIVSLFVCCVSIYLKSIINLYVYEISVDQNSAPSSTDFAPAVVF